MSIIAGLQQAPGQAMPMGMGQPPMPGMKPPMGGAPAGVSSLIPNLQQLHGDNAELTASYFLIKHWLVMLPTKYCVTVCDDQKMNDSRRTMDRPCKAQAAQQQAQQQQGTVLQEVASTGCSTAARHGAARRRDARLQPWWDRGVCEWHPA
jgi:hypothetical protein